MGVGRPYCGINEANPFDAKRNHIIGIGINEYKFATDIDYCRSDIEDFVEKIVKYYDGFEEDKVTTIFSNPNQQPTKSQILDTISNRITCLTSMDNVIIYFSGHGINDDKMFYFAVYNSKPGDLKSFISFDEILKILNRQNVKHFIFIVDACYSGKIFSIHRSFEEGHLEENADFWKRVYVKKSIWVLTSGGIEKVLQKSPFIDTMLKVFDSFAKSQKPLLMSDLKNKILVYLSEKIKQTPMIGRLSIVEGYEEHGGEFVFFPRPLEKCKDDTIFEDINEIKTKENTTTKYSQPPDLTIQPSKPTNISPPINKETSYNSPTTKPLNRDKYPKKRSPYQIIKSTVLILILVIMISLIKNKYANTPSYKDTSFAPVSQTDSGIIDTAINHPKDSNITPKVGTKETFIRKNIKQIDFTESSLSSCNNTMGLPNLVFLGSFNDKNNAKAMLEKLKLIGYDDAEIIMKENMPYAIVISGFYQFKSSAKAEVKALKRRGFQVYSTKADLIGIYRNKERINKTNF